MSAASAYCRGNIRLCLLSGISGGEYGEFCQRGRFLTDDDRLEKIPRMLPARSRCRKQQATTGDQPGS
ncbi:hypothetical protein P4W15_16465 [Morganella morganii]|nr:hypothetical protein [Morganella morganii]